MTKKNEIEAAIRELEAEGEKITIDAVRKKAGGGSYSTINPILREWRENKSGHLVAPPEIQRLLSEIGDQIWTEAEKVAGRKFAGHKVELEKKIEDLRSEAEEKDAEIVRLEEESAKLIDKIADLETELNSRPTQADIEKIDMVYKTEVSSLKETIATFAKKDD